MTASKAFVAGWPISHSRSPRIHRFWLDRHGIEGAYSPEAVQPEAAETFFRSFHQHGYCGGNVTLPHKEAAFRACDRTSDVATRLQAVNTLWREGDQLCGDNTDAYGFAANLDAAAPEWRDGSSALVIGAGGAARAVLEALIGAGYASVTLLNRTPARAESLAAQWGGGKVRAGGLDAISGALPSADLIVNSTSAGLHGEADLPVDWQRARKEAIATDLLYVPLVTPFLQAAVEHGLTTVDGLGMLLHQAVPGFERWFGVRPDVDAELRDHIVADLTG